MLHPNPDLLLKCATGVVSLGGILFTAIKLNSTGHGAQFDSTFGSISLGKKIEDGNSQLMARMTKIEDGNSQLMARIEKMSTQVREFKLDVDNRMDKISCNLENSNAKNSKELNYLRGLATQTHVEVQLMKKKWGVTFSESDISKHLNEGVAEGRISVVGRVDSDC
jgi:hypothetical protein